MNFALAIDGTVYDFSSDLIWAGKNSSLTLFQSKLSEKLVACGQKSITADGAYGKDTQSALNKLFSCPDYSDFADGPVTFKLWDKLFDGKVFYPSVEEQALTLTLTYIGSDFTRVKWVNSNMIWFPFKARIGSRINQVGEILKLVFNKYPNWAPALFGSEMPKVKRFINRKGRSAVDLVDGRKNNNAKIWWNAIRKIANDKRGREIYIQYAFRENKWYRPSLDNILGIIGENNITEIDYAFAMDLSTSYAVSEIQKKTLIAELKTKAMGLARKITSAERRQFIASKLTGTNEPKRMARNVAYYIGTAKLNSFEKSAWSKYGKINFKTVGLKDQFYEPYLSIR